MIKIPTHKLIKLCISAFFLLDLGLHAQTIKIVDKPVVFDEQRKKLSLEYLKERHGVVKQYPSIVPKMIVLHWTAIPTLEESHNVMNPAVLPGARADLAGASNLNVASHFLVDRDGTIYRQLPDTAFARHVIGLNYCAIGVENVGSGRDGLTPAQLKSNEELIRYLKKKYDIEYVIGHYEYKLFRNDPLWKETDPNYLTSKSDPGEAFMKEIRERIKDLGVKGPPGK